MLDQNTIRAVAESGKAIAESNTKTIEAATGLAKFFHPAADECLGILTDYLRVFRWERRIKLWERAKKFMSEREMTNPTRKLPLNFIVPLLDNATLEEDDYLQTCWAKLLVNAGDATSPMEIRTCYVSILSQMSAFDVKILSALYDALINKSENCLDTLETWHLPIKAVARANNSTESSSVSSIVGISLSNLSRQGCLDPGGGWGGSVTYSIVTLTELGKSFARACIGKG